MKVMSLFSGCGGADLGFRQEGFELIFASDINKACCDIHELNFNEPVLCMDITRITKGMLNQYKSVESKHPDIIIGGPPCQSFSNARTRAFNSTHDASGLKNVKAMQDIVHHIKPKMFICENVGTLADDSLNHAFTVFKYGWNDYNVHMFRLNSTNYGLPQSRERLFFVGMRKDLEYSFCRPVVNHYSNQYSGWLDCAMGDEWEETNGSEWTLRKRTTGKEKVFPWEPSYTILASEQPVRVKRFDTESGRNKLWYDLNGVTISRLKPRECARLQGFPDSFKLSDNVQANYMVVGNAWSVTVARALAKEVRRVLSAV